MNDTSYTYADLYAGEDGITAYAQTDGMMTNYHDYAVDVTLTSPNGRVNSVQGALVNGTAAGAAFLGLDASDLGEYRAETTHRGWCYVAMTAFVLSWKWLVGTLGESETYYKDPVKVYGPPRQCYFQNTACSSETPTCTSGWGFGLDWDLCNFQYASVYYLTWNRLGMRNCLYVGLTSPAYGPGPCN